MNIMSFEDFKRYYEKYKIYPGQVSKSQKLLSDSKLLIKYNSWYKKEEKKLTKVKKPQKRIETKKGTNKDLKWLEVVKIVKTRDNNECQFISRLLEENMTVELQSLMSHSKSMLSKIDPAHIIAKSKGSEYYYNPDNIVCLNRVSHSYLDSMLHPVLGTSITREERDEWWIFIIGKERWNNLNV